MNADSDQVQMLSEEINAVISLSSFRCKEGLLRETDSDIGSDRWCNYVICRPYWGSQWFEQPPPATQRRLA